MKKYPAFFFGHWSPMNAILDTQFSKKWTEIGKKLEKPKAILSISAHFETQGTYITAMNNPRTIYDFWGFPRELYEVKYEMKGSEKLALEIITQCKDFKIFPDYSWWIDHGTWTILKYIFPHIWDIPVLQLSIDISKTSQEHYALGNALDYLREEGVMIMGSGDIVHNLYKLDWNNENAVYNWACEVDNEVKEMILNWETEKLLNFKNLWQKYDLAIPSTEHFIPLIYIYALKWKNEKIEFFNEKIVNGSLSMTSFIIN